MIRRLTRGFPTSSARFGHFCLDPEGDQGGGDGGGGAGAGGDASDKGGDRIDTAAFVQQGVNLGKQQFLEALGAKDLDEVKGLLDAGRKAQQQQKPKGKGDDSGGGDTIDDHPVYRKVAGELGETQRERDDLRAKNEKLARMADEARREKIRNVALSNGVGAPQADAFLAMFGDRFRLGADGSLEALGRLADGTVAPLGQKPKELVAELLKEHQYLVAPAPAGGAGSQTKKTTGDSTSGISLWETPGDSALDRRLKRGKR